MMYTQKYTQMIKVKVSFYTGRRNFVQQIVVQLFSNILKKYKI